MKTKGELVKRKRGGRKKQRGKEIKRRRDRKGGSGQTQRRIWETERKGRRKETKWACIKY